MLSLLMTATATTTRRPAPDLNNKIGARTTWLQNVKVVPVMLPQSKGVNAHGSSSVPGMPGTATYRYETYTESHEHTKDGATVTEIPDIRETDLITIDGISYTIKRAVPDTLTTGFGKTLYIYLDEDNA